MHDYYHDVECGDEQNCPIQDVSREEDHQPVFALNETYWNRNEDDSFGDGHAATGGIRPN